MHAVGNMCKTVVNKSSELLLVDSCLTCHLPTDLAVAAEKYDAAFVDCRMAYWQVNGVLEWGGGQEGKF